MCPNPRKRLHNREQTSSQTSSGPSGSSVSFAGKTNNVYISWTYHKKLILMQIRHHGRKNLKHGRFILPSREGFKVKRIVSLSSPNAVRVPKKQQFESMDHREKTTPRSSLKGFRPIVASRTVDDDNADRKSLLNDNRSKRGHTRHYTLADVGDLNSISEKIHLPLHLSASPQCQITPLFDEHRVTKNIPIRTVQVEPEQTVQCFTPITGQIYNSFSNAISNATVKASKQILNQTKPNVRSQPCTSTDFSSSSESKSRFPFSVWGSACTRRQKQLDCKSSQLTSNSAFHQFHKTGGSEPNETNTASCGLRSHPCSLENCPKQSNELHSTTTSKRKRHHSTSLNGSGFSMLNQTAQKQQWVPNWVPLRRKSETNLVPWFAKQETTSEKIVAPTCHRQGVFATPGNIGMRMVFFDKNAQDFQFVTVSMA